MPVCDYTAGLVAGFVSIFIGHPLDTIKTQQQLRAINFSEAAKRIHHHRGWKGFYRGLSAPLFANGGLNAVFFGVYGDIREYLVEARKLKEKVGIKQATYSDIFISGTVAGLVTLAFVGPIELVKTKLQSQMKRKQFKGPIDCLTTILREAGIKGLFRGMVPLIMRDGPGSGAYMVTYEVLKSYMEKRGYTSHGMDSIVAGGCAVLCYGLKLCEEDVYPSSLVQTLLITGVAGIVNWAAILPFDTIKTRMQGDDHVKPHYRSMSHVAKEIYRTDGMIGLYRGFWSVSARAFPVNASIFLVYELIQTKICNRV